MRSRRRQLLFAGISVAVAAGGVAVAVTSASTSPSRAPHHRPSKTSGPPTSGATTSGATTAPARSEPHVMVIVMENHGYAQIVGNPTAPYLNALVRHYGVATASYATTHPSLPNYLALVSGSTQGIASDCTTCTANRPQLVDQLQRAGISWAAYMEGAPSACFTGTAPPFDRHHDPFVYAPHIVSYRAECDRVVPFGTFGRALATGSLPAFVWVTPDVAHDMHTGSVAAGDTWLHETLVQVLASSWYQHNGAVIVTFDEGTGGTDTGCCGVASGGHVLTIVVSRRTPHGARLSTPVDGAGVLRTIEALYHLPYLGDAADGRSGTLLPLLGMARAPSG